MKISIVSKSVFAVALMFSLSSFASDKKENREVASAPKEVMFNAGMFQLAHSNKIKLAVDKSSDSRLRVVLKDKAGKTFYSESYGRGEQQYRRIFDLEGMNDGIYYFELTIGEKKIYKEVKIQTNSDRVISFE